MRYILTAGGPGQIIGRDTGDQTRAVVDRGPDGTEQTIVCFTDLANGTHIVAALNAYTP